MVITCKYSSCEYSIEYRKYFKVLIIMCEHWKAFIIFLNKKKSNAFARYRW